MPVASTSSSSRLTWRKASYSMAGECVEIAELAEDRVGMRNSNHPELTPLSFPKSGFRSFLAGAKAGEFDDLVTS